MTNPPVTRQVTGPGIGVRAVLASHRDGQLSAALQTYEAALAEGRLVGMANTVQYLLADMGHIALLLGDADRAEWHFAEGRTRIRRRRRRRPRPTAELITVVSGWRIRSGDASFKAWPSRPAGR